MHQHLNEDGRESLRPKGSRIDNDLDAQAGRAAAHGRSDVDPVRFERLTPGLIGSSSVRHLTARMK